MIYQLAVMCAVVSMTFADGYIGHAKPYAFGYSVKDHHGEQHRQETGDGGHSVKGSYGFTDDRGVHRQVDYVADHGGFRAQVKTNEPGTANQDPAAVKVHSSAHPYFGAHGVHGGAGYGLGYGGLQGGFGGGYGGQQGGFGGGYGGQQGGYGGGYGGQQGGYGGGYGGQQGGYGGGYGGQQGGYGGGYGGQQGGYGGGYGGQGAGYGGYGSY